MVRSSETDTSSRIFTVIDIRFPFFASDLKEQELRACGALVYVRFEEKIIVSIRTQEIRKTAEKSTTYKSGLAYDYTLLYSQELS